MVERREIHLTSVRLMFTLFKAKRQLRLLTNERMLKHYLTVLRGLSDAELARGLDMAAEIKSTSLEFEETHTDYWNAFNKPVLINERTAENIQSHWVRQMVTMNETESEQGQLYAIGMSIWSHSLLAAAYPELRKQGLVMWDELQRGFRKCIRFNPRVDVPEVF
jgi:hypothetical protein